MFDGDCDGKLSRGELVTAITHMQSMRWNQNGPHANPSRTLLAATVVNGGVVSHNTSATSGESGDELDGSGVENVAVDEETEGEEEASAEDIADSAIKDYGSENVCSCEVQNG